MRRRIGDSARPEDGVKVGANPELQTSAHVRACGGHEPRSLGRRAAGARLHVRQVIDFINGCTHPEARAAARGGWAWMRALAMRAPSAMTRDIMASSKGQRPRREKCLLGQFQEELARILNNPDPRDGKRMEAVFGNRVVDPNDPNARARSAPTTWSPSRVRAGHAGHAPVGQGALRSQLGRDADSAASGAYMDHQDAGRSPPTRSRASRRDRSIRRRRRSPGSASRTRSPARR